MNAHTCVNTNFAPCLSFASQIIFFSKIENIEKATANLITVLKDFKRGRNQSVDKVKYAMRGKINTLRRWNRPSKSLLANEKRQVFYVHFRYHFRQARVQDDVANITSNLRVLSPSLSLWWHQPAQTPSS